MNLIKRYNKMNYTISTIGKFVVFILAITIITSCIKDEENKQENREDKINITIEDFGDDDTDSVVKSPSNREIYSKTIELEEGEAEIKIVEDKSSNENINTKAASDKYTIFSYKNGNTLDRTVSGTVNGEGNFTINSTGKALISGPGNYTFICVANQSAISGNNVDFNRRTHDDYTNMALISDNVTKNITSDIAPISLSFLMRHVESAVRVQINSDENIPAGFTVNIKSVSAEPNVVRYILPGRTLNTPSSSVISLSPYNSKGTGAAKSLTTEYKYFLGGTGKNRNLTISFSGTTTICGIPLNMISSVLTNLPIMEANKRYTVVITFKKPEKPNIPDVDIKNLPAWRWTPFYIAHGTYGTDSYRMYKNRVAIGNSAMNAPVNAVYEAGWTGPDAINAFRNKNIRVSYSNGTQYYDINANDRYHLPGTEEFKGLFPPFLLGSLLPFDKDRWNTNKTYTNLTYFEEEPIIFGNIVDKFHGTYWATKNQINDNSVLYDVFGIKLYKGTDYSRACAYRYRWINHGVSMARADNTHERTAYLQVKVIYIGNDAKFYLKNRPALEKLFINWDNSPNAPEYSKVKYKILDFGQTGYEGGYPNIYCYTTTFDSQGSTYYLKVTSEAVLCTQHYSRMTNSDLACVRLVR